VIAPEPRRKILLFGTSVKKGVSMAYDAFLKLTGITGESQKENHVGDIDLQSFSWAASNSSSVGTGTGASTGDLGQNVKA
jgi:type VI protein secretion system component Hcp